MFYGFISYALFIFWCCGTISIFVDVDHVWSLLGKESSIRFSDSFGRPFHTRTIFTIIAVFASFIMVTFGNGFYREILRVFGEEGFLLVMVILNVITYYGSKRVGKKLGIRLYNKKCQRINFDSKSRLNKRLENNDYNRNKS